MRTSANIFIGGVSPAPRSTDLLLAWSDAADDVHAAYLVWRTPIELARPTRSSSSAPRSTAKRRPRGR
jgi:hypothetical protein